MCGFYQKERNQEIWPTLQWSDDEAIACRCVNNEVHFFDGSNMSTSVINKLHLPNVKQVSIAPGNGPRYGYEDRFHISRQFIAPPFTSTSFAG